MNRIWDKRIPWFEILLVLAVLAIQFRAAFSDANNFPNNWFNRDDAYYYFKVAQNIGSGLGSSFDGINPTNGYHPLWLLICIPIFRLARFDLILPLRVLLIVISLFNLLTGLLFYWMMGKAGARPAGMLAAVFWVFDGHIQTTFYEPGLESALALMFILLVLYLAQKHELEKEGESVHVSRIIWLGSAAALMVFSRLDLVFFAVLVGLWVVFRDNPMRYLMPMDILALTSSVFLAFVARLGFRSYYEFSTQALVLLAIVLAVHLPLYYFLGLYQRPSGWRPLPMLWRGLLAVAAGALLSTLAMLALTSLSILPGFPRMIFLIQAGLTFFFLALIRGAGYILRDANSSRPPYRPLEYLKAHWTSWLQTGGIYYGIVGGSLGVYMVWNKMAFGTSLPVSGQVKQWWGSFTTSIYGSSAKTLPSFLAVNPDNEFNAWQPLTNWLRLGDSLAGLPPLEWLSNLDSQARFLLYAAVTVLALFLVVYLAKGWVRRTLLLTGIIPLLAGSWIQIFSYNSTGYASPKDWYWLTEQVLLILSGGLLVQILYRLSGRLRPLTVLTWMVLALIGLSTAATYWVNTLQQMPYGAASPSTAYMSVLPFLEEHTPPGSVIGMTGGGNVGYFIQGRTIVNMDGLINSFDYFQALKSQEGATYLYQKGMRYVFANADILTALPYRDQYKGRLQLLADYGGKDLYRLLDAPASP